MSALLPEFFDRATTDVAQDLLGKFLIREYNGHRWALLITEVEAYDGPEDKASHAYKGRTEHTEPMFAPAGVFYIPQTCDMKKMLHIVAGPKDYPAAVLIRSALIMLPTGEIEHVTDPAKLTSFLRIGSEFNGIMAAEHTSIWFEDREITVPKEHIVKGRRMNAAHAEDCKDLPYNFSIEVVRNIGATDV